MVTRKLSSSDPFMRGATIAALTATVGLAAACWGVSALQMNGMDMGFATQLGSFTSFIGLWVVMMAAMMLPGAVPSVLKLVQVSGSVRAVLLFVGSYLTVWALFGVGVYVLYRPHGCFVAGAIVIAGGVYELTPVKKFFREHCSENVSGVEFGLCCVGSSVGLMLMMVALGIMSIMWMVVVAVLIVAQKLLPARAAIDMSVALAIIAFGILIVVAPMWVHGIMPSM
jgi:predicted metal-binding membrane protein